MRVIRFKWKKHAQKRSYVVQQQSITGDWVNQQAAEMNLKDVYFYKLLYLWPV